jgi:glycosyltransferase involved in cell wall biosynthesis
MQPSAMTGGAARAAVRAGRHGWSLCRRAALRVRGSAAYTPPWSASVLDDVALNRPWNLVLRALRAVAAIRLRLPGTLGVRSGVTVVIVNWNGCVLMPDVLAAIERYSPDRPNVMVVDNASSDGSQAWLRAQRHRLRPVFLPRNIYHGPAMDLGFLLSRTEHVVALDVDAFPIRDDWLESLRAPLCHGATVSGAQALRGYAHPCCLMMRLDRFVARRHTFQPHVGEWRPERLGLEEWDTGESISRREGDDHLALLPRTHARGPGHLGSVFGDLVFHNGASVRLLAGDRVEGIEMADVRAAWSEAVARYVPGAEPASGA